MAGSSSLAKLLFTLIVGVAVHSGGQVERTELGFRRDHYTAAFGPISDGCEERPGWFASFDGRFRIWWSKDRSRLLAEETGRFPGGHGCPPAVERIRWTATRRYGGASEGADEVL